MQRIASAIGLRAVHARGGFWARRLARQASNCRRAQQDRLRRLLQLNAGTCFQQDHRLSPALSTTEYRRRLPITTYADVARYVDEVKRGHVKALCGPKNRPLMFAQTSGTSGESKFIPITRPFLRDYRRGWTIWAYHAFEEHDSIPRQKFLQIISDYDRQRTPSGVPCGNISGLVLTMQPRLVQNRFTVSAAVLRVRDPAAKSYLTLRLGLAEPNVGLITTANPSTLVMLAQQADAQKDSLIRDIYNGTLAEHCEIPNDVRRQLQRRLARRDVTRARQLSRIAEQTGHLYPRNFWPEAALIAVWTGGSAAAYLPDVRRLYGDVPIRDHGLSASEGRMTIPLEDETPAGLLDISSHFFEFIPEAAGDNENPQTLLAHELEVGECYFIVLTTASGLYRYNIFDVVRCTGFFGTTPLLEFLHKGAHISSVTGEKLTESQVVAAVAAGCEEMGCRLSHYTVTPLWGERPTYRLLLEEAEVPSPDQADRLAATVEEHLQRSNCEYREKRASGRLGPLRVELLPPGTWARYITREQSRPGASLEQYKHPCLKPDLTFRDDVLSLFEDASPGEIVSSEGIGPARSTSSQRGHPLRS